MGCFFRTPEGHAGATSIVVATSGRRSAIEAPAGYQNSRSLPEPVAVQFEAAGVQTFRYVRNAGTSGTAFGALANDLPLESWDEDRPGQRSRALVCRALATPVEPDLVVGLRLPATPPSNRRPNLHGNRGHDRPESVFRLTAGRTFHMKLGFILRGAVLRRLQNRRTHCEKGERGE